jgi:hypothetical protein
MSISLPIRVSAQLVKFVADDTFTITLASLTNGSARQSTLKDNSTTKYPAAIITLALESGTSAPTVGTSYEVFLLRKNASIGDDNCGDSDAAITIENAFPLGTIIVTASGNKLFYKTFDTAAAGPLGPHWGIAVRNSTGQTMHATEGNHLKTFQYYYPESQ